MFNQWFLRIHSRIQARLPSKGENKGVPCQKRYIKVKQEKENMCKTTKGVKGMDSMFTIALNSNHQKMK